jgi:hypothetical protein
MFEAYSHSNHEGLIAASCIEKEVRFGSIASIWRPARYSQSTDIERPIRDVSEVPTTDIGLACQ